MKALIGIRREDKNPWEKRVPLIPSHGKELMQKYAIEIWIQPSSIRVFPDEAYSREGVRVTEDLSPCPMILAVKEIPLDVFQEGKAYVFFSHTIKGQPQNMPMLKKMMDLKCTLIDYEKIVDEKGQRLVFFGRQAGQAGMIDTLWALGQRLEKEGFPTPFSRLFPTHRYGSLVEAKEQIQQAGWQIHKIGLDKSLVPLICGFTGYGHVSRGAQEIFDLLPYEELDPRRIVSFVENRQFSGNKVYKVVFKEEHLVKPKSDSLSFDLQDYYANPQNYVPIFETYLPYVTILVNCIYWSPKYPRFVTKKFLKELFSKQEQPRLRVVGDISCDVGGSVECTVKCTSPDNPVYVYDPLKGEASDGFEGKGPVILAVDNLPAEMPLESSVFFSQTLMPFIPDITRADFSKDFSECGLPEPVRKAVILYRGELTPDYIYMNRFV